MTAEGLHREAALLSNELHTFRDEDVEGVKPLIDRIVSKRKEWKALVLKIKHFEETGQLPEEEKSKLNQAERASYAQLKVELQLINQNISNRKKKIRDNPEHRKVEDWTAELAMLEAQKIELKTQMVSEKYATT
jgi:hypothetical protein